MCGGGGVGSGGGEWGGWWGVEKGNLGKRKKACLPFFLGEIVELIQRGDL